MALQMSEAEVDIVMAVASGDIPLVKSMLKNHPELVSIIIKRDGRGTPGDIHSC